MDFHNIFTAFDHTGGYPIHLITYYYDTEEDRYETTYTQSI